MSTGTSEAAVGRSGAQERRHRGSDGEGHGVAPRAPPGPIRDEALCCRVLPRRHGRASPRPGAQTLWRRWWPSARISTASPPATVPTTRAGRGGQGATRALFGSWRPSVRPPTLPEAVRHPGPVGLQLRGSDHERVLRFSRPRAVDSMVRSADYSAGDVLRTVRGITATQAALLPERRPWTWRTECLGSMSRLSSFKAARTRWRQATRAAVLPPLRHRPSDSCGSSTRPIRPRSRSPEIPGTS